MSISQEKYKAAYAVGLSYHDGKIKSSEIRTALIGTGLSPSYAYMLATNVSYLLKGQCYKRAIDPVTDDYLTWIRRDRGNAGLAMALRALESHIAYRRALPKPAASRGLERILRRHQALLEKTGESMIVLEWQDAESKGWMDWLPLAWFAEEGEAKALSHSVGEKGKRLGFACCDVTVRELSATLDYRPYAEANRREGVLLGMARLTFRDEDRTSIASVEWQAAASTDFESCRFATPPPFVPPAGTHYQPSADIAGKSARMVRDRPGQTAFRRTLKLVYGERCCISGCAVPEALEGAHIDRYQSEDSNHIQNGLLLRRDLHTLFDRYLIAIDPETMSVHVARRARGPDYDPLHGVILKVPDEPTHRPDQAALHRHWQNKLD